MNTLKIEEFQTFWEVLTWIHKNTYYAKPIALGYPLHLLETDTDQTQAQLSDDIYRPQLAFLLEVPNSF